MLDNGTKQTNYNLEKNLMNNQQSLMPQAAQPVNRLTTGQLPTELAELSEEALQLHGDDSSASVLASQGAETYCYGMKLCSYDGDDAE